MHPLLLLKNKQIGAPLPPHTLLLPLCAPDDSEKDLVGQRYCWRSSHFTDALVSAVYKHTATTPSLNLKCRRPGYK